MLLEQGLLLVFRGNMKNVSLLSVVCEIIILELLHQIFRKSCPFSSVKIDFGVLDVTAAYYF